jgi:hypothetical protein
VALYQKFAEHCDEQVALPPRLSFLVASLIPFSFFRAFIHLANLEAVHGRNGAV